MKVMKFRKKPVVIEALIYTGENHKEIESFIGHTIEWKTANPMIGMICTLEGTMALTHGDFLIKGINGEFYPCKPDIFVKTYEVVND
jgi:hypothetical protein